MFSRMKIAAVAGLVGGLTVACAGVTQAFAASGPAPCASDLQGNVRCSQRIVGEVPEGGVIPHQETCARVQPLTLPAAGGSGVTRLGPEVTCAPAAKGVPPERGDGDEALFGLMS
ncbi:hypothetical protein ABZ478_02025 [Streptomyces sp. NPDC005706]|uniref:hypothetical protein n=1 Tax=Streptomyces sp. NPDC005706 TaxID=3157169 RepID=UPI0034000AF9